MMEPNRGDDVTISGTVQEVVQEVGGGSILLIQTAVGLWHWVRSEEIKAWCPQGDNGGGKRAIVGVRDVEG